MRITSLSRGLTLLTLILLALVLLTGGVEARPENSEGRNGRSLFVRAFRCLMTEIRGRFVPRTPNDGEDEAEVDAEETDIPAPPEEGLTNERLRFPEFIDCMMNPEEK
ncbi:uncharacterized protein LOC135108562 isoform X2 [Scylla paramamosain]